MGYSQLSLYHEIWNSERNRRPILNNSLESIIFFSKFKASSSIHWLKSYPFFVEPTHEEKVKVRERI